MLETKRNGPIECDVVVIGGGPGGSTIAALLAKQGWRVELIEKARHPRFHIGESLLPMNLPLLQSLGVKDQIDKIGIEKHGAEFNAPEPVGAKTYYFKNALDRSQPMAYQVKRAEFDHILLENCAVLGAKVHQDTRVTGVNFSSDSALVDAISADGTSAQWKARYVVDASGRDTFLANRLQLKQRNPKHASAAMFAHFSGARRLSGIDEGNISVYWFDFGWFWLIPLPNDTMSVGAVCTPDYLKSRQVDPTQFFLETLRLSPGVSERLKGAKLCSDVTATGNYSYQAKRMAGDKFLMVGDAFAFVDPVFSSGVLLAMKSAFMGAEVVDAQLKGRRNAAAKLRRYEKNVRYGVKTFSWFIYRVRTPAFRHMLLHPQNRFRVEEAMVSLLSGDIFGRTAVRPRLVLFKAIYYAVSMRMLKASLTSYFSRRAARRTALSAV